MGVILKKNLFRSKIYLSKTFFNEFNSEKSLKFNTVYGRRHSKLFTNCHVSRDTL